LNRLIKLALDTGEASTIEEAHQIFAGYRMQIVVGADVGASAGAAGRPSHGRELRCT